MRPPIVRIDRSLRKALAAFNEDRLGWHDQAASLGPLAGLRFGPVTVWVTTDPSLARSVLISDAGRWRRQGGLVNPIRMVGGDNLFTQEDKAWALIQPALAPDFRKRAIIDRIGEITDLGAAEVAAIPAGSVDLELCMRRIALVLAAWVLFGDRLDPCRAEALAVAQREVVTWVGERVGSPTGAIPIRGASSRAIAVPGRLISDYADELIAKRRVLDGNVGDVLGALLEARPGGRALSDSQLRGQIVGLLVAGNETTATALCWALVHGAGNPEQWRRLAGDEPPVEAFIDETLRLSPPGWGVTRTPRRRAMTIRVGGCEARLFPGFVLTIYIKGMHTDPTLWPRPEAFDLTRHSQRSKEQEQSLLSFGLGPRGCIGQQLALAEMRALLPLLARRGQIAIYKVPQPDAGFGLRPRGGLSGSLQPNLFAL